MTVTVTEIETETVTITVTVTVIVTVTAQSRLGKMQHNLLVFSWGRLRGGSGCGAPPPPPRGSPLHPDGDDMRCAVHCVFGSIVSESQKGKKKACAALLCVFVSLTFKVRRSTARNKPRSHRVSSSELTHQAIASKTTK